MNPRRNALRLSMAAAIVGVIAALPSASVFAQQKMVMKASDVHPAGYPTVVAVENMARAPETLQEPRPGRAAERSPRSARSR